MVRFLAPYYTCYSVNFQRNKAFVSDKCFISLKVNIGLSDYRTVGLSNCRTIGLSDYRSDPLYIVFAVDLPLYLKHSFLFFSMCYYTPCPLCVPSQKILCFDIVQFYQKNTHPLSPTPESNARFFHRHSGTLCDFRYFH